MLIKVSDFEIKKIDYRELKPIQGDLKSMSKRNSSKLQKSFEEKGLFVPLFVWEFEGSFFLLDGHGREKFFLENNIQFERPDGALTYEVPCIIVQASDLNDAKEKVLIISSQYHEISVSGLKSFSADMDLGWVIGTTAFDKFGDSRNIKALLKKAVDQYVDPDAADEESEAEPRTKKGDLWSLGGKHLLLCGDSTDSACLDFLRREGGVERYTLCLTDPPYCVEYQKAAIRNHTKNVKAYENYLEGSDPTSVLRFIDVLPSSILIMAFPLERHFFDLAEALKRNDMYLFKDLVWVKNKFAHWPRAVYQQKHESLMVFIKKQFRTSFFPGNVFPVTGFEYMQDHEKLFIAAKNGFKIEHSVQKNQTTVLEFDRVERSTFHPTEKPLDLWSLLVRNHVPAGDVFIDPFAGSGTSIMAAEENDVRCHAIEISGFFCDKILQRYELNTNKKAVLLKNLYES